LPIKLLDELSPSVKFQGRRNGHHGTWDVSVIA
jgi:hypothetical protein